MPVCVSWGGILTRCLFTQLTFSSVKLHISHKKLATVSARGNHKLQLVFITDFVDSIHTVPLAAKSLRHILHVSCSFTHYPINSLLSCSPAEPSILRPLKHSSNPSTTHTWLLDLHGCSSGCFFKPKQIASPSVLQHLYRDYYSPDPFRPTHALDLLDLQSGF